MPLSREQLAAQKQAKIDKILETIANHVWRYGYQPTLREVARSMGWASPGYVQTLLTHHFRESLGGRNKMQGRAIAFDWMRYVTVKAVSWHSPKQPSFYPSVGTPPKRAAKRKLGTVSKSG